MRNWWIDPRLASATEAIHRTTSLDHLIWLPDTSVYDSTNEEYFPKAIRTILKPDGSVYTSRRYVYCLSKFNDVSIAP